MDRGASWGVALRRKLLHLEVVNSDRPNRSGILTGMELKDILNQIDSEIARLQQARAILAAPASASSSRAGRRGRRVPAPDAPANPSPKRRKLSPEARARISAAVKRRWAAQKEGKKGKG